MTTKYVEKYPDDYEEEYHRFSCAHFIKRLFDILFSVFGLVILSPFFIIITILIKREDAGPVFFRGPRLGFRGKVFQILKFRTMINSPESYLGARITAQGDPRITPIGQWLRATKLNELPQLWNVLIGEMSLVGPRPEDPNVAEHWPEDARREILSMRPGITSPASVAYYDEERLLGAKDFMSEYFERILPDKLRLDRLYVRHHTFLTDLDAIFWTLLILVPRFRKNKLSEGWLFGGPFTRLVRTHVSWFVIDFFLALNCISVVGLLWRADRPINVGFGHSIVFGIFIAFLFGLLNTVLGVKTVSWSRAAPEDALSLFFSACMVIIINYCLYYFLPITTLPRDFVLIVSLLILLACIVVRYRLRVLNGLAGVWLNLRQRGYGAGERVIIVGAGEGGSFASWLLNGADFRKLYSVVGIVDDDPAKQGRRYDGFKVLGTTADIPTLVSRYDVGIIIYAISKISQADSDRIQNICKNTGRKIVNISSLITILHLYFAGETEMDHVD